MRFAKGIVEAYGWNEIEPRGKISGIPAKEIFSAPKYDPQQGFKTKTGSFSPGNGRPRAYI